MKSLVVSDIEFDTGTHGKLRSALMGYLEARGCAVEEVSVGRDTLAYCMGCFGCWVKKPGECIIGDRMGAINRSSMTSDAVFYLCPIVFGQFSANMKNVIDRWLPNMLPFFEIRPDGSTMHPPRYADYPRQVMIGYGEELDGEDARLFTDINRKHRSNAEVLIYRGDDGVLLEELGRLTLTRIGGRL